MDFKEGRRKEVRRACFKQIIVNNDEIRKKSILAHVPTLKKYFCTLRYGSAWYAIRFNHQLLHKNKAKVKPARWSAAPSKQPGDEYQSILKI